jgi:hypothetical protein
VWLRCSQILCGCDGDPGKLWLFCDIFQQNNISHTFLQKRTHCPTAGVHKLPRNLGAPSKFHQPEGLHRVSSMLMTHCYGVTNLWTSVSSGTLCSVHAEWYTFLYLMENVIMLKVIGATMQQLPGRPGAWNLCTSVRKFIRPHLHCNRE